VAAIFAIWINNSRSYCQSTANQLAQTMRHPLKYNI